MNLPDIEMINRLSGSSLPEATVQQWITDLIPVYIDEVKSECLESDDPQIQMKVKLGLAYITASEIVSNKASSSEGKSIGIGPIKLSKDASTSNYLKFADDLKSKGLKILGRCLKSYVNPLFLSVNEYGG